MPTTVDRLASRRPAVDILRSVVSLSLIALCIALAWTIVFVLRIGPVVAVIDARDHRGVHSGDLLAFPLVAAGGLVCAEAWARHAVHAR